MRDSTAGFDRQNWRPGMTTGICGLPIPQRILELIEAGRWKMPSDPVILGRCFPSFAAPDEVIGPRFYTVDEMCREPKSWLQATLAPTGSHTEPVAKQSEQLHPKQIILIGDVGIGWDAPIALDFTEVKAVPRVIHLAWINRAPGWIQIASDIDLFIALLRL